MPMREEVLLQPITIAENSEDALDLARRAQDYVVLEVGHAPDMGFIHDFFTATPPDLGPECLIHFGLMEGPAMVGMIGIARGYEYPDDWWIGLMLVDPAFRSQRIGHKVVQDVKRRARAQGVHMLKLAVLNANPRAVKFWLREGFKYHRDAPATPGSDGHDRVVLKHQL
jgi:GNAT superfamily N-acetyltransferase